MLIRESWRIAHRYAGPRSRGAGARNVSAREGEPEYVVDTDDLDIMECERVEPEQVQG